MPTVAELIEYYINLLIIQYKDKPNIRGTVSALVNSILMENLVFSVRDSFNLETATGKQLDIIGKYAGVDRFFNGLILDQKTFAFANFDNTTPSTFQAGFSLYSDFETKDGIFLQYGDTISGSLELSDNDYRTIIKLKIIQNNINHSHASIDNSLFDFFGADVRASSPGNMKMVYFVPENFNAIIDVAIQKEVLPRPLGVGILYVVRTDDVFYGYASYAQNEYSDFVRGFSTYSTFDNDVGKTLEYNLLEGI